jgi:membrane associated rhomboid family serine protease
MGVMLLIRLVQYALGEDSYVAFMMSSTDVAEAWGRLMEGEVTSADLWAFVTLFTAGFLHADLAHWGSNMIFMWMFGSLLSELVGNRLMLLIFLATVVGGSACHAYLNAESFGYLLGASGGVMGLEGAYLGIALRFHLPDPQTWPLARPVSPAQLVIFALIGVAFDMRGLWDGLGNVAYGAHLGGFVTGVVLTGLLLPLKGVPNPRR